MSDRKWTVAQQSAIEDEGGSLLLDAAAGSGKTAVLIERAVRLMTKEVNPVAADRLLILTFTNAAAQELRARLAKRLEKEREEKGNTPFLRRQKNLLQRAFIGTVDSFCLQLVRENFAQLGTTPDVAVGQGAVLDELSEQALQQTLEEAYKDEDFVKFSALYGRSRSDKEAADAIVKLHEYVDALPWPQLRLNEFATGYDTFVPLYETPWGKELLAYATDAIQSAKALSEAALQTAEDDGGLDAWLPMLKEDVDFLSRFEKVCKACNWNEAERFLRGAALARLATVRQYEGDGKEQVKFLRDGVKNIFAELKKYCLVCSEEEYREDLAMAAPLVKALCATTQKYRKLYFEKKLENRTLDFSDFEHLTLQLLMSPSGERLPAAEEISSRYDMVMVDEYQDTNELQSALYTCFGNASGSNLFYVGDVKQSIYRFRRANPGLFLQKKNTWAAHESGKKPAVLRLGHNFRSGPSVVEGANYLFGELMSEALGEVCYDEQERLLQGGSGTIKDGFSFVMLEEKEDGDEAMYVAETILQMIHEKVPVQEGNQQRPCEFGDFCILLRTRSAMDAFQLALEEAKIPVSSDLEQPLLSTPEVLPIQAALAAIDNPGDDVQLAATMLGPLFSFTLDELAELRACQKNKSLYGAVLCAQDDKSRSFVQTLSQFRALSTEMDTGRLCEELVLRTGYLSAVAAMEGGEARRETVYCFLRWASEMGNTLSGGLAAFVRLLQRGRGPKGAGYQSRLGHVSLITAHKSKGLEFPIVIFADTSHKFNLQDRAQRLQFHTKFGIGLQLRTNQTLYPTLPFLAIRHRSIRESLSEEMRVLYVALTRARDRLHIVYATQEPAKRIASLAPLTFLQQGSSYLLSRQNCFGDWILSALLRHPHATPLWKHADLERKNNVMLKNEQACFFNMGVKQVLCAQKIMPKELEAIQIDEEAVAELQAGFDLVLTRKPLQEVPRKLSVSALSKAEKTTLYKRPAFLYPLGLTAAERGTAMHRFLQLADYKLAKDDLEKEIIRLEREHLLSPEQAASLNRKGLAMFFNSPLFGRMQNATRLMREYDFITAIPAFWINPSLPQELSQAKVYLQGIADAVLVGNEGIEIADYKTDRGKTPQELQEAYVQQLHLYARAVQKRLNLPVQRLSLWSFALSQEVDVPLERTL